MAEAIVAEISASPVLFEQVSSKKLYPKNRLVYGVGVNDVAQETMINGKLVKTYQVWTGMLKRVFSDEFKTMYPSYVACTVDCLWLHFSKFEKWMLTQDYEGKCLDKDILLPGNKVYSPATCVFVSNELNQLLLTRGVGRGDYPLGVSYDKARNRYKSQISINGLHRSLGRYLTPLEAHKQWQLAKANYIANFPTDDPRIRVALDKRVTQLREDAANGRVTEKL